MSGEDQRVCTRCKISKPITVYHRKGERKESRCKTCISEIKAATYKKKMALLATTKKRRRNSRVIDLSQYTITDNWNELSPKSQEKLIEMFVSTVLRGY